MCDFKELKEYYQKCFSLADVFHFNSSVAQEQYDRYLKLTVQGVVLPITHSGIVDHRIIKDFSSPILRLGFIGNEAAYKGFPILKNVLSKIDSHYWLLNVWGGHTEIHDDSPIRFRGKFNKQDISQVYHEIDLLIVPSIWKETFSLVTLEALSYGVPVLVSENVGAKAIVQEYDDYFIYQTVDELEQKIREILKDRSRIKQFNQKILRKEWTHDFISHAKDMVEKVYGIMEYK